ncbi:UNC93-like protein 3 [Malus domestica]|uniref:UNC93-like protein 3 n=1 Tax=Malus domestica TaxID=3750 RepID=UPI003974DB27
MTLGTILMCFLSKRDDEVESLNLLSTLSSSSMSLIHPLFDIRRLLIIPPWHIQDYNKHLWVEFTKYIVKPMLGMSGVGGEMAVYGAFDAVSITLIVTSGTLVQAAIFIWLLLFYSPSSGLVGTMNLLIMSALLGIGDGVFNTQLSALIGIFFKHNTE